MCRNGFAVYLLTVKTYGKYFYKKRSIKEELNMKKLATYKNGNTITTIYDDGTKTHFTKDDEFDFAFPECHDISISRCCDNGCSWPCQVQ